MKRQNQKYGEILNNRRQLGPYPMQKLKRVEQPTTKIIGDIRRIDPRDGGFIRGERGEFGPVVQRELHRFGTKDPVSAAQKDMIDYLAAIEDNEVASTKAPIPEDPEVLSYHIKRLGYFLRADIVGICQLPQYALYSHDSAGNPIELNHKFAIVVVADTGYTTMNGSTGSDWISNAQSMRGYSNDAFITAMMANYIRRLGYPAQAHYSHHYQLFITPLLVWAGIGELSRAGIALNPFIGSRFKAGAVTTDLPLVPDKPVDFGLQEFCRKCMKCAVECPPQAIPTGDKVMYNGYETWKLDAELCSKFRPMNQNGAGCGTCIKVCPWNKPEGWTHDMVRWMVKNTPLTDKLIVKMDDILGYGKQDKRDKWWFDIEEVDGVLKIPKSSG